MQLACLRLCIPSHSTVKYHYFQSQSLSPLFSPPSALFSLSINYETLVVSTQRRSIYASLPPRPPYHRNVVIIYVTILAPSDSPNSDGIDPGTYYMEIFILICDILMN